MPKKTSPANVSELAINVRNAWVQVGTDTTLAGMDLEQFMEIAEAASKAELEIKRLESELTHARNLRDDRRFDLWQTIKRVRLAARVAFGEDSSEYELFGGTRASEHRSRTANRSEARDPAGQPTQ